MYVNEAELKNLIESAGGDQELYEGISDIFKRIKLHNFTSRFMEKGQDTVYFAYSKGSNTFAKAVFENGKLTDTVRYNNMAEMEEDLAMLEAEGYKPVSEAKITRFIKFFVRNLGRLIMIGGIANFIAATIIAAGAGLGVGAAVGLAIPSMVVSVSLGWIFATVAKKEDALTRDHAAVARQIKEGENVEEEIRQMVREQIQKQAEELTKKKEKEKEEK